jgi:hypothetical protein
VAGEHEVDELSARVLEDDVGVVGFVGHEDDWTVGFGRDGEVEIGLGGGRVVEAAEPNSCSVALDGQVLVDEYGQMVCLECSDDEGSADGDVVIAEDGVALGAGYGAEDLSAAMDGVVDEGEGEGAVRDEVSGEEDEVGSKSIDAVDDELEEPWFGVLVEVDIADLDDAKAVEGLGEITDGDGPLDDVDLVAGDLAGVEGECGGCCPRAEKEVATGGV